MGYKRWALKEIHLRQYVCRFEETLARIIKMRMYRYMVLMIISHKGKLQNHYSFFNVD